MGRHGNYRENQEKDPKAAILVMVVSRWCTGARERRNRNDKSALNDLV